MRLRARALASIDARILSPLLRGGAAVRGRRELRRQTTTVASMVERHFTEIGAPDHPCRPTMSRALELLEGRPATILETGSSAWGTNSSLLFDAYVEAFGGAFATVDVRTEPMFVLARNMSMRSIAHCRDSVAFLAAYAGPPPDLVYLDSWDVAWDDPDPSAIHGLREYLAIAPRIVPGALLLIDDTPADTESMRAAHPPYVMAFEAYRARHGFYPGKGALVRALLRSTERGREIASGYQLLWQF